MDQEVRSTGLHRDVLVARNKVDVSPGMVSYTHDLPCSSNSSSTVFMKSIGFPKDCDAPLQKLGASELASRSENQVESGPQGMPAARV